MALSFIGGGNRIKRKKPLGINSLLFCILILKSDVACIFTAAILRYLFHKGVVRTKFDIYICITITGSIPRLTLSVPDEGSSRKALWVLNLISTFLLLSMGRYLCWLSVPDEDYSRKRHEHYIWYLRLYYYHWVDTSADFERTWWRFF